MKKVLLVNPYGTEQDGFSNPPLGLLYIAGMLLRHGIDVKVVDGCLDGREGVSRALREYHPDWVGITCLTPGRKNAIEVARMAKSADAEVKVVMGGAHPTIMFRQMLEHYPCIDFVVMGEGEYSCLELVQGNKPSGIKGIAYRNAGEIIKTSPRTTSKISTIFPSPHGACWMFGDIVLGAKGFSGGLIWRANREYPWFFRGGARDTAIFAPRGGSGRGGVIGLRKTWLVNCNIFIKYTACAISVSPTMP